MAETILVVDDDPVQRRLLEAMVRRLGYEAKVVDGGEAALAALAAEAPPDLVILDLVMPDLDGMGVLGKMRERGYAMPVIVQTAHGGIDVVISAMKAGASDFVVKPVGLERLQVSLRNALAAEALTDEIKRMKRKGEGRLTFKDLVSKSPRMVPVLRVAEKAATSNIPVLIEGESGVGKEMLARAIHGSSDRKGRPFVAVNCGAIPLNLVESILFGHEKGAFTGATEKHTGKFVEADGGTLFLDEVGELPPDIQVKLLRALQTGEVDPVGGRRAIRTDFRLISATNRSMLDMVREGAFREDLFYRLHVYPVSLPPLRERREDIADLVRLFVARFAAEEGKRIRAVSAEAMALLGAFPWPGNVRQLENAIFRAVVLAEGDELSVAEFPHLIAASSRLPASPPVAIPEPAPLPVILEAPRISAEPASISTGPAIDLVGGDGEVVPLETIERETIRFAIRHYRGQMSQVARRLGIGRSTLYRRLKDLGLDAEVASED